MTSDVSSVVHIMIKRAYVWPAAALLIGAAVAPVNAQEPSPPTPVTEIAAVPAPPSPAAVPTPAQARYQIRVMEGVLENAVQHGAQIVTTQMRQISPDLMVFSGPARARGYRLDGYGVFFSIDVPAVRRSVTWSFRTLNQGSHDLVRALQALRRNVQSQGDARTRAELEHALRLVELQVGPVTPGPVMPGTQQGASMSSTVPAGTQAELDRVETAEAAPVAVRDPDAAYEAEVKNALTDAMLDYGPPLSIGPDEWLTVAARDTEDRLVATELGETVTIVLRIRGGDLSDYRAGRLTRDEARGRVEVREF